MSNNSKVEMTTPLQSIVSLLKIQLEHHVPWFTCHIGHSMHNSLESQDIIRSTMPMDKTILIIRDSLGRNTTKALSHNLSNNLITNITQCYRPKLSDKRGFIMLRDQS